MSEMVGLTGEPRFDAKLRREGDCIVWTAYRGVGGYGRFLRAGRLVPAHRFAYERVTGATIKYPLVLDHLCRVRACVNPEHLEPVSTRVNTGRGIAPPAENARKTVCIRGHAFTTENTYVAPRGDRQCRTCRVARDRRVYAKTYTRSRERRIAYQRDYSSHNRIGERARALDYRARNQEAINARLRERRARRRIAKAVA